MYNQLITTKETEALSEYTARLESTVASLLNTVDQLEKELYFVIRKNMQLEQTEVANAIALIRNPLCSKKEFRA